MSCEHENFHVTAEVARILDSAVWYVDLRVRCSDCQKPMEFIGFPMGLSPGEPRVSIDGQEAHLPFKPFDDAETELRGLKAPPGFNVSFVPPREPAP